MSVEGSVITKSVEPVAKMVQALDPWVEMSAWEVAAMNAAMFCIDSVGSNVSAGSGRWP